MPEDKLSLVTRAQENYIVAVTGDGVNDLPAVRRADVGIAVANAVDALKGTADIVLLASGHRRHADSTHRSAQNLSSASTTTPFTAFPRVFASSSRYSCSA